MSSFNIIVPSDTNSKLYPENTSSRFKVKLSEPIELDQRGNWEVALAELQVPAKLQKQDYQMVVHSTHPDSTEQRKTTNREDFLTDLQKAINKINVLSSITRKNIIHFNVFSSNIQLKTYNGNIVNPPVIVFEFTGECDSPTLQNVMFLRDSQVQSGHLGDSLPMKLKLNHVASLFLGISKTASIVSPWPVVPRFNFDRSMFQPETNETLYLPLDENQARMTECYTNTGYYIYFYQHIFMIKPKAVYIPYTNESLVAKMNEMTLNPFTSGGYRFYIYPNSQVFKVDLVKREGSTSNLSVKIPEPLCQVLGWETEKEFNLTAGWEKPDGTDQYQTSGNIVAGTTSGTTYSFCNKKLIKIDVNRGYNIMYVYAPSLIQDVHVGHTKTELLNYTVPGLAEVRGDSYFVQFNSLSYVKVKEQLHSINELLVEIRNELGDLFEFTDVGQRPTASLKFEISDQL